MAKVTEVYMKIDGEQTRFSMQEYLAMREYDPHVRALKFIVIDHRMYEANMEQFVEWKKERNHISYLKECAEGCTEILFDAAFQDEASPYLILPDKTVDVEAEVVTSLMLESLQNALTQLTEDERKLVQAIYFDGMSEREYAKAASLAPMTVHNRKVRILGKLKKLINNIQK